MTKSKIIADLTSGNVSEEAAIERLLIIGLELDNKNIESWAESELKGYETKQVVPSYRKCGRGLIRYSGLVGNLKMTNVALQYETFDDNILNTLNESSILGGVASIKQAIASDTNDIQRDLSHLIGYVFNKTGIQCTSLYMYLPISVYQNVISGVRVSLIKALRVLENSFGNLDSLDLKYDTISSEAIVQVEQNVTRILYADNASIDRD